LTSTTAARIARPIEFVVRLAALIWSHGVFAVSGVETRTRSTGSVASCAAIWASAVSAPWPISTLLVCTFRLPSTLSLTKLVEGNADMPLMIADSPLPRTFDPSRLDRSPSHPIC
jgi:hypothetical protein